MPLDARNVKEEGFQNDDTFWDFLEYRATLVLSLVALLWLLDVEGGPLFGTPFPLGIVEYLLSLDVL